MNQLTSYLQFYWSFSSIVSHFRFQWATHHARNYESHRWLLIWRWWTVSYFLRRELVWNMSKHRSNEGLFLFKWSSFRSTLPTDQIIPEIREWAAQLDNEFVNLWSVFLFSLCQLQRLVLFYCFWFVVWSICWRAVDSIQEKELRNRVSFWRSILRLNIQNQAFFRSYGKENQRWSHRWGDHKVYRLVWAQSSYLWTPQEYTSTSKLTQSDKYPPSFPNPY